MQQTRKCIILQLQFRQVSHFSMCTLRPYIKVARKKEKMTGVTITTATTSINASTTHSKNILNYTVLLYTQYVVMIITMCGFMHSYDNSVNHYFFHLSQRINRTKPSCLISETFSSILPNMSKLVVFTAFLIQHC